MPSNKSYAGSTTMSGLGLVITGDTHSTISTFNGNLFDETSVPDLPGYGVGENCLVGVDGDALFSVGGGSGGREVFRYAALDDGWDRLPNTNGGREGSACGHAKR